MSTFSVGMLIVENIQESLFQEEIDARFDSDC